MKCPWFRAAVVSLMLVPFLLAACAKATPTAATTAVTPVERVFKIGVSVPLSGFGAGWGIPYLRGLEMVADKVNAAGGLNIGGARYPVKLYVYDNKFSAADGGIIAQRLVNLDKVKVIAVLATPATMATRDIARDAKVIRWGLAFTKAEPNSNDPLAFATTPKVPELFPPGYSWLAKEYPKVKNIAILTANQEWGPWAVDSSKENASKNGLNMVAGLLYEAGTKDFSPSLLKIMAGKPDMIDLWGAPPDDAAVIIKQARLLGYTGQFVNWNPGDLPVIQDLIGKDAEGVITGDLAEPYPPQVQEVVNAYKAKYSGRIGGLTLLYYAGYEALMQAAERAQSVEPTAIAKALTGGTFDTIWGKVKFGGKANYGIDNQIITALPMSRVTDGRIVQVAWIDPGQ